MTQGQALSVLLCLAIQPAATGHHGCAGQHKATSLLGTSMIAGHIQLSISRSAAEEPRSHPLLDIGDEALDLEDVAIDRTFWQLFWEQEYNDTMQKLAAQQARNTQLTRQVEAERASSAATMAVSDKLAQQAAGLQDKLQWMLTHQIKYSSRRPPRVPSDPSKDQLRAQLTALQEQRSRHQETMAGLRHELDVLDSIPQGDMGRVLTGDTTIDELRAAEQRLVSELAARQERKAERKNLISELQAEVQRLEELGTSAEREARLKSELQEAHAFGAALQCKLDAQQGISQDGSGTSQDTAAGASSSTLVSTCLDSLTQEDSLSTEGELWQEDNLSDIDMCDLSEDSSFAEEDCVSGQGADSPAQAHKGSLEESMALRTPAILSDEEDEDCCWN